MWMVMSRGTFQPDKAYLYQHFFQDLNVLWPGSADMFEEDDFESSDTLAAAYFKHEDLSWEQEIERFRANPNAERLVVVVRVSEHP